MAAERPRSHGAVVHSCMDQSRTAAECSAPTGPGCGFRALAYGPGRRRGLHEHDPYLALALYLAPHGGGGAAVAHRRRFLPLRAISAIRPTNRTEQRGI